MVHVYGLCFRRLDLPVGSRPFHAAGIPFLYEGVGDHAEYHKATNDADRIDADFYGRAVETIIGVLRQLDASLCN